MTYRNTYLRPFTGALAGALALGCAAGTTAVKTSSLPGATARLVDATGTEVGRARLSDRGTEVALDIEASKLPPGLHGFHIHERGTCARPAFKTAGEHLNPSRREHGLLNPRGPHSGDLPNLRVDEDGSVDTTITVPRALLEPGPMSLVAGDGTALVIHAGPDDQRTDPSGNSGDRIACGVIRRA